MPTGTKYWNSERAALLSKLWREGKTFDQIVTAFGGQIDELNIRRRAKAMGFYRGQPPAVRMKPVVIEAVAPRGEPVRFTPRAQPGVIPQAQLPADWGFRDPPKPERVTVHHDLAPCPFYDPREKREPCGEMVDRRTRSNGTKPSQYCRRHRAQLGPIANPAGPMGAGLSSGGRVR